MPSSINRRVFPSIFQSIYLNEIFFGCRQTARNTWNFFGIENVGLGSSWVRHRCVVCIWSANCTQVNQIQPKNGNEPTNRHDIRAIRMHRHVTGMWRLCNSECIFVFYNLVWCSRWSLVGCFFFISHAIIVIPCCECGGHGYRLRWSPG